MNQDLLVFGLRDGRDWLCFQGASRPVPTASVRIGARMEPELRAENQELGIRQEPGARDKTGTGNREQDRNQGLGPRTGVKGQKTRT